MCDVFNCWYQLGTFFYFWEAIGSRLIFHPGVNLAKMRHPHTYLVLSHQNIHTDQIDLCLSVEFYGYYNQMLQETSSPCSLLHQWVRDRVSFLARDSDRLLWKHYIPNVHCSKPTSPNSLNLTWKVLKGDTVRLQPWFIIRRVRWLYIVAYTNRCHKD